MDDITAGRDLLVTSLRESQCLDVHAKSHKIGSDIGKFFKEKTQTHREQG
jgi:hypothetical protein